MWQDCNYIFLDGARMGFELLKARELSPSHVSLYRGESEVKLSGIAPYIFPFDAASPLGKWYLENGWGESWGIPFRAPGSLTDQQKHFRQFLKVQTEAGKQLLFRFYDPRALRIVLPTFDAYQLKEFFGSVQFFLVEDDDPGFFLRCSLEQGTLKSQRLPAERKIPARREPLEEPKKEPPVQAEIPHPAEKPAPPRPKSRWNTFE